jgi:recombination protein RecR
MKVPKSLADLIDSFERLPGIGPKTAQRLSYYLLHVPQTELSFFASSLENLKKNTVLCSTCRNVSEVDPCPICADISRNHSQILVVEQPLDILAFEKTAKYQGLYHVLHGSINPLENIGPDELYVADLFARINASSIVKEIILATNPTMEGEATAMYISKKIRELKPTNGNSLKLTRLGVGVPTGAHLEFADETTLIEAFQGRKTYD